MSRRLYYTNQKGCEYVLDMSDKEVEILCKYFTKYDFSYFMENKCLKPITYDELRFILERIFEKENGFKHIQYILDKEKGCYIQHRINIGGRWAEGTITKEPNTYISLPFLFAKGKELKMYIFTYTKEYEYHRAKKEIEIDGIIKERDIACDRFEVKYLFEVTEDGLKQVCHKGISAFSFDDTSSRLLGLYIPERPCIDTVELELRLIDYFNTVEDYKQTEALGSLFNKEMYKRIMEFFNTESDYNKNIYREVIRFLSNTEGYWNLSLVEFEKRVEFLSDDWFTMIYN